MQNSKSNSVLFLKSTPLTVLLGCLMAAANPALADDRATVCGQDTYNVGSGSQCGEPTYNQGMDPEACGTTYKEIWSDWGRGCNDKLNQIAKDYGYFAAGFNIGSIIQLSRLVLKDEEIRFDKGFPEKRYKCKFNLPNMCRHPKFDVASWPSCRHPDFGIAPNPGCDQKLQLLAEFKTLAAAEKVNLPLIIRNTRVLQANYYAFTRNETGYACSIQRASRNPLESEHVTLLEQTFMQIYSYPHTDKTYDCSQMKNINEATCPEDDASEACTSLRQYKENITNLSGRKYAYATYEKAAREMGAQMTAALFAELYANLIASYEVK